MSAPLASPRAGTPVLQVSGLHVHYGASHALQGVDLALPSGVLSVVGRNGMGKTTLCKAIMGLVRASAGSVRLAGEEVLGRSPASVARMGVGYVPQGRRLWPSLTVDEHLRLTESKRGAWTVARVYDTFPRLAERKGNRGGQLSGGEQQMLAISRALLLNPRLLVMDEPTEGLAPLIVAQVEDMLLKLGEGGDVAVLVIEQNIGVATEVSDEVAVMVNGRVLRVMPSAVLAADRELQQSLLGVGRHGHAEPAEAALAGPGEAARVAAPAGPARIYLSNPTLPTRWSQPVPVARIEAAARTVSAASARRPEEGAAAVRPLAAVARAESVLVVGTLDTKGAELRFMRDVLVGHGIRTRLVDLSTSGKPSGADVPPGEVALHGRGGARSVFTGDRGASVAAMAEAFETWVRRQDGGIAGILSAGGSGGTTLATAGMRALPVGVPKLMVSTVASGQVARYVGPADVTMMYSVTDVEGLSSISRKVLANAAEAMAGMVKARQAAAREAAGRRPAPSRPAVGLTMFGVTTPCVQAVSALLGEDYERLVFHATGIGGQSLERLVDEGAIGAVIDVSTTEVPDLLFGGVHPATEDRFGAVIRTRVPYVGSVGALDMVNFGPADTVPERYAGRLLHRHNPNVTLMRTTPAENAAVGAWIGERLNRMDGPVRFLIPEGGVSALDAPGRPFHDPAADSALFDALEATVRETANRRLVRLPHHLNDPAFAAALVDVFRSIAGAPSRRRRLAG